MRENTPKPSMIPAPNHFQYATTVTDGKSGLFYMSKVVKFSSAKRN